MDIPLLPTNIEIDAPNLEGENETATCRCNECSSLTPILKVILQHMSQTEKHQTTTDVSVKHQGFLQKLTWHFECEHCQYKSFYHGDIVKHTKHLHPKSTDASNKTEATGKLLTAELPAAEPPRTSDETELPQIVSVKTDTEDIPLDEQQHVVSDEIMMDTVSISSHDSITTVTSSLNIQPQTAASHKKSVSPSQPKSGSEIHRVKKQGAFSATGAGNKTRSSFKLTAVQQSGRKLRRPPGNTGKDVARPLVVRLRRVPVPQVEETLSIISDKVSNDGMKRRNNVNKKAPGAMVRAYHEYDWTPYLAVGLDNTQQQLDMAEGRELPYPKYVTDCTDSPVRVIGIGDESPLYHITILHGKKMSTTARGTKKYAFVCSMHVLALAGVFFNHIHYPPRYDQTYKTWYSTWFDEEQKCRFKGCTSRGVNSAEPDRRRLHVLQHLTRTVCGFCLRVSPSIDVMTAHVTGTHRVPRKGLGLTVGGGAGKFILARDRLEDFIQFFRTRGMSQKQEAGLRTSFANVPECPEMVRPEHPWKANNSLLPSFLQ